MSAFVLKIIAIISMTFDHMSYLIFGEFSFMNYIGRIAFPIFAYQITEGYIHTHNLKKYFFRLFIFSLISQIPFMLFTSIFADGISLNIFFTLLLGLGAITIYDALNKIACKNKITHISYNLIGFGCVCLFAFLASITSCDYGYFGVFIIFFFYLFRNKKLLMNTAFITMAFIYYGQRLLFSPAYVPYLLIIIFTIFPLLFINLYNHKKGKDTKYFLYIFYPLHLLIIYGLSFLQ
ncbi:MAG: conjugal transfer protein TraX [Clostridia bacterium]|nr:conjugal transfer protein TraX [Clostridia bacterium]MCI9275061.1 conjugal transfer protein TraX [Clostridia bacterium]